jgi:N-acyl-D-amino-acid deacylase
MDIIIKNGIVVDGTGRKRTAADVGICKERIVAIGELDARGTPKIIDARGGVICPGFIDTHSHSDLALLVDPFVPAKIRQGITTEILGQDGIAMAPLPISYITSWRKNLVGLSGDSDDIDWTYETTRGYLNLMAKSGLAPNAGYLVPHGNVRMEAMGLADRTAGKKDLKAMVAILEREMDAGAFGLSTGLIYIPCAYADTRELIELCRVVARRNGVFVIHQRSEADGILPSMEEVFRIGRESGVKIHFSHMKVCGRKNWDKLPRIFEMLDQAAKEGISVSFDQYPYVAGSTMLGAILPPWAHDGGTERLLERLRDKALRRDMIRDIQADTGDWDNFVAFAGLDGIFITSIRTSENRQFIGKNLIQLGKITGKDPYEAVLDLLLEEENAVGMLDFYGKEDHLIQFLKRPEMNVCTDGLLGGKPHPRVFGAFPRILSQYVRQEKILTLEQAVHKMTGKPAEVFAIGDRGILKPGNFADIVVFDPDTICDRGTYQEPDQFPDGISHVMVNGRLVLEDGHQNRSLPGKVLRHPGPSPVAL